MWGLSLVAASGGHSSSPCAGLSLSRPLLLRSTSSRHAGSVVVAYGPSCPAACGIFPDQGSNPCPLHWQADSQPPRHQGSPKESFIFLRKHLSCESLEQTTLNKKTPVICLFLFSFSFLLFLFSFLLLYMFSICVIFFLLFPLTSSFSSFVSLFPPVSSFLSHHLFLFPLPLSLPFAARFFAPKFLWLCDLGPPGNWEVPLEMKRLHKRLVGTGKESMCITFKFSKLECYTAIKNDGPENDEMGWKQLICYIEMKNSGCKVVCAAWLQLCLKSSLNLCRGKAWKEIHQKVDSHLFQVGRL